LIGLFLEAFLLLETVRLFLVVRMGVCWELFNMEKVFKLICKLFLLTGDPVRVLVRSIIMDYDFLGP
jgi:hypothetical protein